MWCYVKGVGHSPEDGQINYQRRCAKSSAMQAFVKQGFPIASGMETAYVVMDA
jgi:hypothetical protein